MFNYYQVAFVGEKGEIMKKLVYLTIIFTVIISCERDEEDQRPANEVWMSLSSFVPTSLNVTAGTTVRWVNTSAVPHNVVSNTGLFRSNILNPDQDFSFTFEESGVYSYVCELHPGMAGTINVE
jgi:plastocyanin